MDKVMISVVVSNASMRGIGARFPRRVEPTSASLDLRQPFTARAQPVAKTDDGWLSGGINASRWVWIPVAVTGERGQPHTHARDIQAERRIESQQGRHITAGSPFLTGAIETTSELPTSYDWIQSSTCCNKL